ncbi:MAG: OmpH family outer membrane protein [Bacteroidales bacterium]|nr:OmpH family outer membrane protein [Bacteroidales bacterium]
MKLRHILILLLLIVPFATQAQKYACVNTDYVLRNLPDYSQAQQRLDKYVSDWQREIEGKMQELETLRQSFQQEAYLLPDNLKNRRAQEIKTRDQEVRDLQRKRFAADGDLDKKRAELLKPIQDRVYSAIERIAKEKGFTLVLDKAGSATVLFASEKIDITNDVLQVLGVKESDADANASETTSKTGKKAPTNPELRTL